MSRVLQAICKVPWAITQDSLERILQIAAREHEIDPEALAALMGKRMDRTDAVTVRDGVAVLSVNGPIFHMSNLLTAISGATSLEILALDLNRAIRDEDIKAILLNINSPGGEVAGTGEFATMIYAARKIKPVYAYIGSEGASAAYWIASAAQRIIVDPTAIVGSIGVIATMSKPDPKNTKEIQFISSQSPKKRPNINTEEGRADVQTVIDSIAEVFVETVARNRGVTVDTVLSDFGQGYVFVGKQAVTAGLADATGTFESALAELAERSDGSASSNGRAIKSGSKKMGFKDKWNEFLASMDAEDETPAPTADADNSTIKVAAGAPEKDRIAALEAENRRLRTERYNSEAVSFADKFIATAQAFPSEREHIIKAVVQAAIDDSNLGTAEGGLSRVSMLTAVYEARPKHQLTVESLTPALANMLRQGTPPAAGTSEAEPTQKELEDLLRRTPLGTAVLETMKPGANGTH